MPALSAPESAIRVAEGAHPVEQKARSCIVGRASTA
jgi:hypothetical protein